VNVSYRNATQGDRVFVISSWLDAFRTSHTAGLIAMDTWYQVMWPQVERILDRVGARTVVAYDRDEDKWPLIGFIVADAEASPPVVFFVYTKQPYRKNGFARSMFAEIGIDPSKPFVYSSKTAVVSQLASKIPCSKWMPLVARFPPESRR